MVLARRVVERYLAIVCFCVDEGTLFEEHFDDFFGSAGNGAVKSSPAHRVAQIHLAILAQNALQNVDLASRRRPVESSSTRAILKVQQFWIL